MRMTEEAKAAVPTTEQVTKTYDMVGYARTAHTKTKGEAYTTLSIGKLKADLSGFEVVEGRYAIYNNEEGMIVKTRPGKGSTEKGKIVGTAEVATDRKGGQFTVVKFNDESVKALFIFPNKNRKGIDPPDFYVTRQA